MGARGLRSWWKSGLGGEKSFLFRAIPFPDGTLELHPAAEGYPVLTFTMEQQERLGIHVAGPVVEVRWPPARRADRSLGNRASPDLPRPGEAREATESGTWGATSGPSPWGGSLLLAPVK